MRKAPVLLVAMALSATIVVAVTLLIATETHGDGRAGLQPLPFRKVNGGAGSTSVRI
ncbi:MAG TPA: hypothetical protein VKR55_07820 [Bradyrhizobium sp.]|uniref:hypothetical protein n=1 Tax=Bradyrhizobium sp. TaxID=376 RepID=UPI002B5D2D93|nr:hypothetical protein [Bradyrhizobium sp.]HLZ02047.1 hypothetical protein [Bradyrhizobium sp.]